MFDYNAKAKLYWTVTALLGLGVLVLSCAALVPLGPVAAAQVGLGAVAAAIAGLFPVRITGTKISVAVADVFVFLLLLCFGPGAATVAAASEAAAISLRTSKRWTSWFGSPALAASATYAAAQCFEYGRTHLPGGDTIGASCVLLLVAASVYFVLGTLLFVSLPKLKRGEPIAPVRILREHFWLFLGSAASASIAGLIVASFSEVNWIVVAATIPIIAVFLGVMHVYLRQGAAWRI